MQTLRFSSSSLSKTIASHLGHFVQSPSGISFFFCLLPPSLGFLRNVVSVLVGGGVTAGSTSKPNDFLVNEVVAILVMTISVTNHVPPSIHKLPLRQKPLGLERTRWWWRRWSTRRQ